MLSDVGEREQAQTEFGQPAEASLQTITLGE